MANSTYPTTKPLYLYQGDDWRHEFTHDYDAIDISDIGLAVSRKAGELPIMSVNMASWGDADVLNANNLATVVLYPVLTLLFDPGIFYYDLQLTVGGTVRTVYHGAFVVEGHAYDGDGGGMGFATTEVSNRLIAWTLGQIWSYTSITRDVDGVLTVASIRWPDNTVGTLTRTAKNSTWQAVTSFTVTYNALTVTQSAITFDVNGNIATRPRPTVA